MSDRLLGVVEQRCLTHRNGAEWQVETVRTLEAEQNLSRPDALRRMAVSYTDRRVEVETDPCWGEPCSQPAADRRPANGGLCNASHVAEFLDVVMHDETLDFRTEQIGIAPDSPLAGRTLDEVTPHGETGVLLLAIRRTAAAQFTPSPAPDIRLEAGSILIAVGTPELLETLRRHARGT